MFKGAKAFSSFSVDDIEKAKTFYGQTLGLDISEEHGMIHLLMPDNNKVLVYPKNDHTPASFTILNFPVEDIEKTVADLVERGVVFEKYPGTDENGIARDNMGPAIAWYKDPAGNILSVLEQ
jgi:catechol 2,3-dioxygenase-like lactoylglutathione lyase family enzyme